jgi:hypothetical protein
MNSANIHRPHAPVNNTFVVFWPGHIPDQTLDLYPDLLFIRFLRPRLRKKKAAGVHE